VFENRVLGKVSGPKRDEVTGEWRKRLDEELHNLCYSAKARIIKMIKTASVV
jgi:hypothetical protein